ncbi:hypothetical protein H0H93_005749 [Arthromyces matolae]|nr:hypothetical protein H0H93_005749 [Arthromyces matolae]
MDPLLRPMGNLTMPHTIRITIKMKTAQVRVTTTMDFPEEEVPDGPFERKGMTKFTILSLRNEFSANGHVELSLSATSRQYETNSDDVRALFEEHGEIKTFFDLISTRGMVFVTYFDLRAAERARDRLQGSEISGRPIDVHYSLPRDDNNRGNEREKNQQLQGNLIVTLRNSPSGAPLDDNEVRKKFQQFGDVKSVKPVDNHSSDSRYVEFYDTRACEEAFDRLRHQSLQDGVMDIVLAWDTSEAPQGQPRERTDWNDGSFNNRGGRGRGRGGFNRGRGRGGGGSFNEDDGGRYGGGDDYGRFGGRGGGRGGRHDDYDGGGGRGMGRGRGYGNRYDRGGGGGGYGDSGPPGGGYGGPSSGYGGPPPMLQPQAPPPPTSASMAPSVSDGERLEQARKVQQLLAALKQPASGAPPGPGPGAAPGILPPPPSGSAPYYGAPPNSAAMPPYPPYGGAPSQPPAPVQPQIPPPVSSTPPVGGPPPMAALSGLPPNILSLMQSAQQQQRPGAPPGQYGSMMMQPLNGSAAGVPPQGASAQSQAQYQQLMSYLVISSQLHTAILLTTTGQLVSFATESGRRPKDEIRMVVGLAMEIWQETQEQEFSMVESELGRIVVVAVDDEPRVVAKDDGEKTEYVPLMLLALNSSTTVSWDELQNKRTPSSPPACAAGDADDVAAAARMIDK